MIDAELFAAIRGAIDALIARNRGLDLARAVSRKNISAEEVAEIIHRFDISRDGPGDDAPVAEGRLQ